MFGDTLQYITKKYPHFNWKNTSIVPQHTGDSLLGFSALPRLSPNSKKNGKNTEMVGKAYISRYFKLCENYSIP